jgi:hypothetical protein
MLRSINTWDLLHVVSLGLLHVGGSPSCFLAVDMIFALLVGPQSFDQKLTTITNMDNQTILKVSLEDLHDDQKALIEQATEEFREKCLLSYSRTRDSVVQKTPLPSVLLHGQSEDIEARTMLVFLNANRSVRKLTELPL